MNANEELAGVQSCLQMSGLKSALKSVILFGDGKSVESEFENGTLTVHLPVSRRTKLPDAVKIELTE